MTPASSRPTGWRLRVAHKLFLLLAMAIAFSLLAMGLLTVHHLRSGFVAYVNDADLDRLAPLAHTLARRGDAGSGFDGLRDPQVWHSVLQRSLVPDQHPVDEGTGPKPSPLEAPPPPPPPPPPLPPPPPPPPAVAQTPSAPLPSRVSLLDADRAVVAGEIPPPGALERPIRVDGNVVGWLALRPLSRPADPRDTAFLAAQVRGMAWLAGLLLLLAMAVAWAFARHLLAPLRDVEKAARNLSDGAFGGQLTTHRQDELGDLVRHVNRLSKALAAHDTARQRWMADISHELRTPLAIVRGELEAMRDGVRPTDAATLASVHEEVMRLGRLVDDLHQWSMADAGSLSYRPARYDLAELLVEGVARFEAAAQRAGIAIIIAHADQPAPVHVDADRMRQLIDNLLSNSLRYTERGGRIEARVFVERDHACLRIDDTPPGVPEEALPFLFQPLYRVDGSRNRALGGSGLGLAIAQRIAIAHGGTLIAAASPLGGLRMELRLPLETA